MLRRRRRMSDKGSYYHVESIDWPQRLARRRRRKTSLCNMVLTRKRKEALLKRQSYELNCLTGLREDWKLLMVHIDSAKWLYELAGCEVISIIISIIIISWYYLNRAFYCLKKGEMLHSRQNALALFCKTLL